jgi:hypothetical protein
LPYQHATNQKTAVSSRNASRDDRQHCTNSHHSGGSLMYFGAIVAPFGAASAHKAEAR